MSRSVTRISERLPLDRWIARGFDRIAANPIRWALIVMAGAVFGGGTVFSLVEQGESMPDGWWWAFVSLTTVGYGDIAPKTTAIRFLASFVIFSGILAVAIVTSALAGRVAERRLMSAHETEELNDDILKLAHELRGKADELEAVGNHLREREENGEWAVTWPWPQ